MTFLVDKSLIGVKKLITYFKLFFWLKDLLILSSLNTTLLVGLKTSIELAKQNIHTAALAIIRDKKMEISQR